MRDAIKRGKTIGLASILAAFGSLVPAIVVNHFDSSSAVAAVDNDAVNAAKCTVANHSARLNDGFAAGGTAEAKLAPDADNLSYWTLDVFETAYGDLNGDKKKDAIVAIKYTGKYLNGENDCAMHLVAMINKNGRLVQQGDLLLGRWPTVGLEEMKVVNGTVLFKLTASNPKNPEGDNIALEGKLKLSKGRFTVLAPAAKKLAELQIPFKQYSLEANANDVATPNVTSDQCWPVFYSRGPVATGIKVTDKVSETLLKNATYTVSRMKTTLKDGVFPTPKPDTPPPVEKQIGGAVFTDRIDWELKFGSASFGDLNGDGTNDAAVLLYYPEGADGEGYELVTMLNKKGELVQVGDVYLGRAVDVERVRVNPKGVIVADVKVHDRFDSVMSPTKKVSWKFRIANDKLIKVK